MSVIPSSPTFDSLEFEDEFQRLSVARFLHYVTFDTQADPESDSYPSSAKQLDLLRALLAELRDLGLQAEIDSYGYVTARLPSNQGDRAIPVVGFLAHVDTSPEMSGHQVKPILHRDYDGSVLRLPDHPEAILDPATHPDLAAAVGHDLITASGLTLLGGDDKAGVAEIMAALEYLLSRPEIPHGEVRVAFTPDEEIGRGTTYFDLESFAADFAYTLDGGGHGRVQIETFSADAMTVTFQGFNTHPGYAKGKMINSVKAAADFLAGLPRGAESPETTEGYEGYIHPYDVQAGVDRATVQLLLRAFDDAELRRLQGVVEGAARDAIARWPGTEVEIDVSETYRNMRPVVEQHPWAVDAADHAMRRIGIEPIREPIRGGTDGSALSQKGLPTPNLSSGQHAIHSRIEWVDVWEMGKSVELIVEICRYLAEAPSS